MPLESNSPEEDYPINVDPSVEADEHRLAQLLAERHADPTEKTILDEELSKYGIDELDVAHCASVQEGARDPEIIERVEAAVRRSPIISAYVDAVKSE